MVKPCKSLDARAVAAIARRGKGPCGAHKTYSFLGEEGVEVHHGGLRGCTEGFRTPCPLSVPRVSVANPSRCTLKHEETRRGAESLLTPAQIACYKTRRTRLRKAFSFSILKVAQAHS